MKNEDIWKKYDMEVDSNTKSEIKKEIIIKYISLVKIISGRLYNYYASNIEYEDLMSYGVIGLIDAIDKFDRTKNIKFETYASIRIRGSIIDQIRNLDWVPRSIRQKSKVLKDAYEVLDQKLGREPSNAEIAEYLGKTESEIKSMFDETSIFNVMSIEDDFKDNYKIQLKDETIDSSPEASAIKNDTLKELQLAIEKLSERDKIIINLYYYEGLTYKEIGEILKISESRVSQIHSKAIVKMRNQFK
ncbi:RNA polymerase sigma factor for flagellar operon FliA [Acetoanaerobium pronyense]|uniref:RNA polymerase sigma factor n=1 Tax=Acetoanaerobium pronyense TaxID=1482736 RepID=A0ABS4KF76_9FIRM|nr:FliA/WhiG family RNA polymerase sigma factor [Acetoanaerobium pronyense]MBP2026425.1 RNA polymerase sigma factor for flagellar operon FliA [Acetoanaerobium pronyense]